MSNTDTKAPWSAFSTAVLDGISDAMPELINLPKVREFAKGFADEVAAKKWLSLQGEDEATRETARKALAGLVAGTDRTAAEMPIREGHAIREKIGKVFKAVGCTIVRMEPSFFFEA